MILCVLYGVIAVAFQAITGLELSPTLTDKWYLVFGTELAAAAFIQITKLCTNKIKLKNKIEYMKENDIKLEREDFAESKEDDGYYSDYYNDTYG